MSVVEIIGTIEAVLRLGRQATEAVRAGQAIWREQQGGDVMPVEQLDAAWASADATLDAETDAAGARIDARATEAGR